MVMDPVADTLIFKPEPDAPAGDTAFPDVEIVFASTVSDRQTAEREIYLKYEFENTHAEPLPAEDFTMNYTEIDWV